MQNIQWNLDLTKIQGAGEIVISRVHYIWGMFPLTFYLLAGLKNMVRYTEDFII